MTGELLKLHARDEEDLQVLSAVLQDAIAPVCDMSWSEVDHNFIMVVHRLRHEQKSSDGFERICCAVNVRGVKQVQRYGFNPGEQSRMLDLLAVMPEGDHVTFMFAGAAKIRIQLGEWSMIIEDFGEPWPAACNPCHDEGGELRRQGS